MSYGVAANPMSYFDHCADHVLIIEAGLIDDKDDPGGITNFGISLRFLKGITPGGTRQDIIDMTEERARALYKSYFWDRISADNFDPALALCVFDCAINQGRGTAIKILQRSVGAKADGVFGQKTLGAVQRASGSLPQIIDLLGDFMSRRAKRYGKTRNFEKYGRGWHRRLFTVYHEAITMLGV